MNYLGIAAIAMKILRSGWSAFRSRPGVFALGVLGGLILAGILRPPRDFGGVVSGQSTVLKNTGAADNMKTGSATDCPTIAALKPTPKQQEKIENTFQLDLSGLDLLSLKEIPDAEFGGRFIATHVPGTGQTGDAPTPIEYKFVPSAAPFIDAPRRLYVDAIYGQTSHREDPSLWMVRLRGEAVRVKGRLTLGAEAGRLHAFGLEEWYAAAATSLRVQ